MKCKFIPIGDGKVQCRNCKGISLEGMESKSDCVKSKVSIIPLKPWDRKGGDKTKRELNAAAKAVSAGKSVLNKAISYLLPVKDSIGKHKFTYGGQGMMRCKFCNELFPKDNLPTEDCSATKVEAITRVKNYAEAKARHLATGSRYVTEEQAEERLAICKSCDYFEPADETKETGKCTKCTCPLSMRISKSENKLRMASSSCPLKPPKWGPVVDE